MTLEILEVCVVNEVNNCINIVHCNLVRKQVHVDKPQTLVSLQTMGFFGTVQKINLVPMISTIYFDTDVPIQFLAKFSCREKMEPHCKRIYRTA